MLRASSSAPSSHKLSGSATNARTFLFHGVDIRVCVPTPQDAAHVTALVHRLFLVEEHHAPQAEETVVIDLQSHTPWVPRPGEPAFRSGPLEAYVLDGGYALRCAGSHLFVSPARNYSAGLLHSGFWTLPPQYQRAFFFLPFMAHLAAYGLFAIHANGLVHQNTGYLIPADSHHGKTTLTLALLRAGWHYVSDDTLVLRRTPDGVDALSFRRGLACDHATLTRFPELSQISAPSEWKTGKLFLDATSLYPGRELPRCLPAVLLFPQINPAPHSLLQPISPADAFTLLLRHSPLVQLDPRPAARHLETLSALLAQTTCFRLLAGADVFSDPEALSRLLAAAAVPPHAQPGC